jgi:hypothetical protein
VTAIRLTCQAYRAAVTRRSPNRRADRSAWPWVNRLRNDELDGFNGFDAKTALAGLH